MEAFVIQCGTSSTSQGPNQRALLQRDLPYALDHDLKTLGKTNLGGAVDTEKQFFGAHFRVVSEPDESKRLVGFNFVEETTLGGGNGVVHFWEFDEAFKRLHKTQHKMPVCDSTSSLLQVSVTARQ